MTGSPSLRERATSGVVWSALHTWGTHALQLGVLLVLARLLEPRDFGLFAMAQVVLVITHALVDQGIPEALVQADREDPLSWSTGFLAVLATSTIAALLLFFGATWLAALFDEPTAGPVIRWMAPIVVLHGIHVVIFARIRSRLVFGPHALAGIAGAAAAFGAGVAAALAGWGVWALVTSAYAGLGVELLLLLRVVGGIRLAGFDRQQYLRLVRYGRFIVASALTTVLNRRSDDYFVGLFLGPVALGYYTAAYRLLELVTTVFLRAVERVAFPVFSKLQGSPALVAEAVHTSFRFTSLAAFPAFAGLIMVAGDLVLVALGSQWTAAVAPLRILAMGGIALCVINVLPAVIRAAGHPQWNLGISAALGVALAAGFAAAARWGGVDAVAWVFTIGVYVAVPIFYLSARKLVPLELGPYLAQGFPAFVATLVMMAGIGAAQLLLGDLELLPRFAILVLGGACLYAGAVAVLAPGRIGELRQRMRMIRARGREWQDPASGPLP